MTTRTHIDALLAKYENSIGTGNMKMAGRTLPLIIRALVAFVEERTPDHVEVDDEPLIQQALVAPERRSLKVEIAHNAPPEAVAEAIEIIKSEFAAPCAPCDVSIPNNPELIEDFKALTPESQATVERMLEISEDTAKKIRDVVGDLNVDLDEPIVGEVDLAHQDSEALAHLKAAAEEAKIDLGEDVTDLPDDEFIEKLAETKEEPPVVEATAPAPKTPKKPKSST
jgi:hypothetical protein